MTMCKQRVPPRGERNDRIYFWRPQNLALDLPEHRSATECWCCCTASSCVHKCEVAQCVGIMMKYICQVRVSRSLHLVTMMTLLICCWLDAARGGCCFVPQDKFLRQHILSVPTNASEMVSGSSLMRAVCEMMMRCSTCTTLKELF